MSSHLRRETTRILLFSAPVSKVNKIAHHPESSFHRFRSLTIFSSVSILILIKVFFRSDINQTIMQCQEIQRRSVILIRLFCFYTRISHKFRTQPCIQRVEFHRFSQNNFLPRAHSFVIVWSSTAASVNPLSFSELLSLIR